MTPHPRINRGFGSKSVTSGIKILCIRHILSIWRIVSWNNMSPKPGIGPYPRLCRHNHSISPFDAGVKDPIDLVRVTLATDCVPWTERPAAAHYPAVTEFTPHVSPTRNFLQLGPWCMNSLIYQKPGPTDNITFLGLFGMSINDR